MQRRMGEAVARVARRVNETVESQGDTLDLADCKLVAFPAGIYKAVRSVTQGIHRISLANNELKALGARFATTFSQLRELNLEGNLLHRLPQELGSLLHLRTINLARNKFRHFPEPLVAAPALESINLEGNEIAGQGGGAAGSRVQAARCQQRHWPTCPRCGASTCVPTLCALLYACSSGPWSPSSCYCHLRAMSPRPDMSLLPGAWRSAPWPRSSPRLPAAGTMCPMPD
uniref:Leucine-rich repeat protein SHOC-2 n=1 Tax=Gallus gallus TaxID=9031 RepID=A0A8V0ZEN9_CHICK